MDLGGLGVHRRFKGPHPAEPTLDSGPRSAASIYPAWVSQSSQHSLAQRALELVATVVFAAYALAFTARLAAETHATPQALSIAAGLVGGYLIADLLSGLAHWVGDRFFEETTPIIGPGFIAPFRQHHVVPEEMVEHGLVELVGNTAVLALPTLAAAFHLLDLASGSPLTLLAGALILSAMVGGVCTNLFHRWAHMERPPRLARWMQALGVVITPERHAVHHSNGFDSSYCITTGWLNAPMDRLGVWAWLERRLHRAGSRAGQSTR